MKAKIKYTLKDVEEGKEYSGLYFEQINKMTGMLRCTISRILDNEKMYKKRWMIASEESADKQAVQITLYRVTDIIEGTVWDEIRCKTACLITGVSPKTLCSKGDNGSVVDGRWKIEKIGSEYDLLKKKCDEVINAAAAIREGKVIKKDRNGNKYVSNTYRKGYIKMGYYYQNGKLTFGDLKEEK